MNPHRAHEIRLAIISLHRKMPCCWSSTTRLFALPIVLSTVNVGNGRNPPTIPSIASLVPDAAPIDRTTINAWEDEKFVRAVKATGRRNLYMLALWTEACLTFPALDAMREGYQVFPIVDTPSGAPRSRRATRHSNALFKRARTR